MEGLEPRRAIDGLAGFKERHRRNCTLAMPGKKKKPAANLMEAVEAGDLKQLQALLDAGGDVHESDEETVLSKAAERGRTDLVDALLQAGADPDFGGIYVPLCRAVSSGNIDVVKRLITARPKVDAQQEDGSTALILAAAAGNLAMVQLLVAAGANPKLRDEDGEAPIFKARESQAVLEFLKPLSAKKDVAAATQRPKVAPPLAKDLVEAARIGNARRVAGLLADGAPVNGTADDGETALHVAAHASHSGVVEVLLNAGAKVDARNQLGRSPLWNAASCGNLELAQRLLLAGADVNMRDKLEGKTPFLACIGRKKPSRDMMRLLARHGADVNAVDNFGRSALSLADRDLTTHADADDEERRDQETLRDVFVEVGLLHPQAQALIAAAATGDLAVVRGLVESGVPVDAHDEQERTALYMAVSRRHPELVAYLLQTQANPQKPIGSDGAEDVQWGGIARPCPNCGHVFAAIQRQRRCPQCSTEFDAHQAFGHNLSDQPLFVSWSNRFLPLMAAAKAGDAAITRMLLDAGADVDRGKDGITPLMTACYYDHLEVAKVLIEHGANVRKEARTPDRLKNKISAVTISAKRGNITIVKLLWDAGAPVKDKKPTLLVDAARRGDVVQIDELLSQGASAAAEDPLTNEEPLSVAVEAGQPEAVRRLVEAGALAKASSGRQVPPLFRLTEAVAIKSRKGRMPQPEIDRYVASACCLIEAGAKVNRGIFGITPLDQAKEAKCRPLIALLEQAAKQEKKSSKQR
jgi:uncharacterized protein